MNDQFSRAADLILDCLEEAFGILAVNGRQRSKKAIVAVLDYYTIPKAMTKGAAVASKIDGELDEPLAAAAPPAIAGKGGKGL
jgi:hypothetical protein